MTKAIGAGTAGVFFGAFFGPIGAIAGGVIGTVIGGGIETYQFEKQKEKERLNKERRTLLEQKTHLQVTGKDLIEIDEKVKAIDNKLRNLS
mgnify:CR=1 FL=1